jgi:hydrogenase/urease accessory protein HupE
MTTKETKTRIANKKVLLPVVIGAIVASVILAGIFIAYPAISSVYAVQRFNTNTTAGMALGSNQIPNIVGTRSSHPLLPYDYLPSETIII